MLIEPHNYGQYIEEVVRRVLEQDFAEEQREILVVDDGSTDDTAKRLYEFGAAIRYLHKTVLYATSFLVFRRSALELVLPIPEALPECLAVCRVHGPNLFFDRGEGSGQRQRVAHEDAARPYETYAGVRIFAGTGSLTRVSDPRNHCSDA